MPEMNRYGVRDLAMPWYAGNPSFLRAPLAEPGQVPDGYVAIVGMPLDGYATSIGRSGMRWGPRRIREASTIAAQYYGVQTDTGLLNMLTGSVIAWPDELRMVDAGDVAVVPNDPEAQVRSAVWHLEAVSHTSGLTVTLGGDHFVAYPAAAGVISGWRARREGLRVGYIHIDSHTDFVDAHHFNGSYHHGSGARRVSEIPEIRRMAWFGLNGVSQRNQFDTMRERGFKAFTAAYVRRVGVQQALEETLDYVLDGVDILYVSVDIDVVNNAEAPATASPVFEGLTVADYLHVMRRLAQVEQLVGLDLCEVDPEIDPSGRTELLAANSLIDVFGNRIFTEVDRIPPDELRTVFLS